MNSLELKVEGMTCGSCVKHVKQALEAVPGVAHVEVDLASGRARVSGELQAGTELLIEALAKEDYIATIATDAGSIQPVSSGGCHSGQSNKGGCCCG
ncbi:MAG: copper-binding protein [Burkholderiales bacterium 35-55-47]|jgi:copper chaperone CopZ|uniref:heavy-metal-associated domain-containing protein n=1 Tax=Limnohabitans sp. TaxID=1907725 RepID=UPI000BD57F04|nr:heavy metal-associated domain-containing protein [Limnohabitans sp.]OYY18844.1 MAG: copper-binding protein [Burkholderiales bacterium 35-55-47]OYZ73663.1 MAG: copper-binding protein [Burkholderiales bacterium 24-55-52]OZB00808.1 MAG: copper-binding protein [Burkholderiales bacterium 39-55-53]HQR85427.1 heavy metal-associated domain-containing protein [Limnohabitans sp.]HQS26656.1 heavy metal-associated domain-containing protein [Limnohabitans sp.]